MPTVLTPPPATSRRWTWAQWQDSSASQRLLSDKDRQRGFSVIWVPAGMRETFLKVARAFRLYDTRFHKPQRPLSPAQLACLRAWDEATEALVAALQESP